MAELKPIGFKPDGSHIHKGAVFVAIAFIIGLYCIVSDAPFGNDKTSAKEAPKVEVVK